MSRSGTGVPAVSRLKLDPERMRTVKWSRRGSCGERGCADPECLCGVCQLPIGVADDDPRWEEHDEWCGDCDLCRDQVPIILFRGEGKQMEQAQFHWQCFHGLLVQPPEIPQMEYRA